jgi:hypothetical protein
MAKVRIKATTDDFEKAAQDQGEFVVPPNGYYVLTLKECNDGLSKDDDGNPDPKRPRLECIYEITGVGMEDAPVEENYGNVWDYVSFSADSGWRRGQWLKAMHLSDGTKEFNKEIETDELIGTRVIGRLARQRGRTKDDAPRAKLRSLMRFEDSDAGAAFGSGSGAPEGDAEAEDYSEEELQDMDLKELGRIAREEFELNPEDSVVKVRGKVSNDKTKDKIVAAILAEQGGSDEAEEDDSPF